MDVKTVFPVGYICFSKGGVMKGWEKCDGQMSKLEVNDISREVKLPKIDDDTLMGVAIMKVTDKFDNEV